nr:glucose-6-phosphate 1-dehydrogenase family protein [Enterococcus wangshanyuanii]
MRSHFWSAYRSSEHQKENACLAVLLNQKQFQVYLMFQHYKSEQQAGSVSVRSNFSNR